MRPRHLTLAAPILFTLLFANLAWADYQAGLNAYRNGDYAAALKEWRPLAQEGNTDAQAHLGVLYAKGQGVPQEYQSAKRWLSRAARKGSPSAQYNLGVLYINAQGLRGGQKAAGWFRKAAVQGHAGAQFNLGCLYAKGDHIPQQIAQAVKWINLAAAAGYKDTKEESDLWEMCWASEDPAVFQDLSP